MEGGTCLLRLINHWMCGVPLGIVATILLWLAILVSVPVYARNSVTSNLISDLQPSLWLDASSHDQISRDALMHVTSWQDKSGNDNNAVAPTSLDKVTYPIYAARVTAGGASALLFDSGFLELSREIYSRALTIFCVVGPKSDDRSNAIVGGSADRGGIEFRIGKPGFGNILELDRQNEESLLAGVKKLPTDRLSIVSFIVDAQTSPYAKITFRVNSSEDVTANLRPDFKHGFQLIGFAAGTDNTFRGYIAEIIVFNRTLGPDDIDRIEHYLTAKYNDPSYPKPVDLQSPRTANTFLENLRTFMRWHVPNNGAELSQALSINIGALCVFYFLFVLGLYGIAPAKFAAWHEWIANRGIPRSENVSKILAPFLLDTPHCLNAVVRRYRQRARQLFDRSPEVKTRLKWVPAPLLLGDELLQDYEPPPAWPAEKPYVAGLQEIKARLGKGDEHWTISIEGPGGVGKSALAFEIARWASDNRTDYRLAPFPMLPILLESLERSTGKGETIDTAAAAQLRSVMNAVKISDRLLQALLIRKRVLAVFDGFSEILQDETDEMIRPEKGTVYTQALVITSRRPTNLPESLVIRPQGLTLAFLDRVLDDLIAASAGSGRFNDAEREELRRHVRSLIDDARDGVKERQVPMIFLKLMIERADQLLKNEKQLDELPKTLSELVTDYTEQLLRSEQDLPLAMHQARTTAHVCMGKERSPAARSENRYTAKGVSKEILDKFRTAGLMVRSGEKGDPFYKFALDPIAEQLDANRLLIDIREERADQAELDELVRRWEELPPDFVSALRRAAAIYRDSIYSTQSAFVLKLWPHETKVSDFNDLEPVAHSGNLTPRQRPMSGLEQSAIMSLEHLRNVPAVFISYAHADNDSRNPKERWLDRFIEFLQPLVSQENFTLYSDQDIQIGDQWHEHIQANLNGAKAVVLFVSPAFLASSYIRNSELPVILKNASDQGVRIFPILISPSVYKRAKYKYPDPKTGPQEFTLSSIQAANPPERTLIEMTEGEQNRVLEKVADQLADLLSENPQTSQKPDLPAEPAPESFSPNPVMGIDRQTTPTQTANFASEHELLLNVGIKASAISTPWRYEPRRRIVRMPRQFVESEGFEWNYQALPLDMAFRQLLLHKAKLDEDSGYNLYLEDLRYFDGNVNELKEEPHQVGDQCEVWDISQFPSPTEGEPDAESSP